MDEGTEAIINAELDAIESSRDRWKILAIVLLAVFALAQIPDAWSHGGGARALNVKKDERPPIVFGADCPKVTYEGYCHFIWHAVRGERTN